MILAGKLDKLERDRIGHSEAMRWPGVDRFSATVEIVHATRRPMSGHRAGVVTAATQALPRSVTKPVSEHVSGMPA